MYARGRLVLWVAIPQPLIERNGFMTKREALKKAIEMLDAIARGETFGMIEYLEATHEMKRALHGN